MGQSRMILCSRSTGLVAVWKSLTPFCLSMLLFWTKSSLFMIGFIRLISRLFTRISRYLDVIRCWGLLRSLKAPILLRTISTLLQLWSVCRRPMSKYKLPSRQQQTVRGLTDRRRKYSRTNNNRTNNIIRSLSSSQQQSILRLLLGIIKLKVWAQG